MPTVSRQVYHPPHNRLRSFFSERIGLVGAERGQMLSHYRILERIGAGSMGEVYRARDPRLGRDVAVKVLPAAYSADPDRLARFEQEARAASKLNHPNILTIHDIGLHEGAPYVVSELLEGETLQKRLASGPIAQRKAVEYALQIAQGLAAAHEKGIVHRDLKPANVFLTKDGRVKILDFGLAKLVQVEDGSTITMAPAETEPGVVMGTVGYMSPEQVRGQPADHRSDIFSFGNVLYEMLSGRRAFHSNTAVETMTAILKEDPAEFSAAIAVPPALERIVRRCLEKAPVERFQSARDLAFALEAVSSQPAVVEAAPHHSDPSMPQSPAPRATSRLPWLLVGGLSLVVIGLGVALWRTMPTGAPPTRTLRLATGATGGVYQAIGGGLAEVLGRKLVNTQVVVRPTDGSLENMILLERGEIDLAMTQNDVAFHSVKTDRILGSRARHIAALCLFYPEPAQIVVSRRANVRSIRDLRGKQIALGLPQSGSRFSSEILLSYFGLNSGDYEPSYVDVSDAARQLLVGSLQAGITWRAIPAPALDEVFKNGQVALLSLDAESLRGLRVANPFLVPILIPAHVYPNQNTSVSTIGAKAMLVGRTDLDDATVDRILEAIFGSIPDLIAHHPQASEISLVHASRLEDGLSIDLHPAARKFFERQAAAGGKGP